MKRELGIAKCGCADGVYQNRKEVIKWHLGMEENHHM